MEILTQWLDAETGFTGPIFWGSIIVVALWEVVAPARPLAHSATIRWFNNFAIAAVQYGLVTWTIGFVILDTALLAESHGWGPLQFAAVPPWAALALGVLWLDFLSYAIHWLFHRVPVLWRVHRVHHSDPDVDFTTARRHHPFEPAVMVPLMALGVLAAGAPPLSLLLWWSLTGVMSLFQHGNIVFPQGLDRVLRWIVITPNMHRVHHSALRSETDSNYGQAFPWWDRLFGTYCARPERGLAGMVLGLDSFRAPRDLYIDRLLLQPFLSVEPPGAIEAVRRIK